MVVVLSGCQTTTTNQYEATARTTVTWQVQYGINPATAKQPRFEEFASASLLNRNGEKPEGRVIGPDDQGLWWPISPPRPTVDEVEQRKKFNEKATRPELLRSVDYQITFTKDGERVTRPTNYSVYRQVVKAYPSQTPLQLTLGVGVSGVDGISTHPTVEKAVPQQ
jgi:hypothetical protein